MMIQLKRCLGYLKSVKLLFTFLGINCFILLGNSFVSAGYTWSFYNVDSDYPIGTTAFSFRPISSSTTILEGGGMTDAKPIIYLHNQVNSNHWDSLYFWGTDSTLYSVENPNRTSSSMVGYRANNFCKINGTDFTSKARGNLCSDAQIVSSGSVYNDSSLKGQMTQIAFLEYDSFSQSANYNAICFVYGNLGFSLCYYNSTVSPNYLSVSASIPGASLDPVAFNKDIIGTSPWVSGNSGGSGNILPDSEVIYYSDNNQIYYDTFKAVGFDENLCYSNFELADTVDITTSYYDLFPKPSAGSGANIFDLYENWGFYPRNPFNSYYSWYSSRYNTLNNSSDKGTSFIMSLYSGVSIGNYYIFDKLYNNEFVESYDLSYKDYYCFCDMAVNGYDPNDINSCDLSISFQNIITNPGVRNGTAIGENGQFILSGANEFGYFSGSADIFDVFNSMYSNFKNAFRVDSSLHGNVGLLPRYIIFGFFLFLLLYILKR